MGPLSFQLIQQKRFRSRLFYRNSEVTVTFTTFYIWRLIPEPDVSKYKSLVNTVRGLGELQSNRKLMISIIIWPTDYLFCFASTFHQWVAPLTLTYTPAYNNKQHKSHALMVLFGLEHHSLWCRRHQSIEIHLPPTVRALSGLSLRIPKPGRHNWRMGEASFASTSNIIASILQWKCYKWSMRALWREEAASLHIISRRGRSWSWEVLASTKEHQFKIEVRSELEKTGNPRG